MHGASVELVNLVKHFDEVKAVDDLSLVIKSGEFVTLLGPSGSGKTTTLMMIAGFEEPTSGDIKISDQSALKLPPFKRNIGVVFQSYALFPHMSVASNIAYPLKMRKVSRSEMRKKVDKALDLVRLSGYQDRYPRQLSGGQQQRVALARALVFDPPLLLMDEPLGALDKKLRDELQLEIKRIHSEIGITIIYVTHDQSEALTMSDRIAVMNNGCLVQYASAEDLYDRPATRFVADFIGEACLLDARVENVNGDYRTLQLLKDTIELQSCTECSMGKGESVTIVLRPEKLRLLPPDVQSENNLQAQVIDVVYLGDTRKYFLQTEGGAILELKDPCRSDSLRFNKGDRVNLGINPQDVIMVAQ